MVTPEVPGDGMDDQGDGTNEQGDGMDGPGDGMDDPEATSDEAVQEPQDIFKERLQAAAQRKLMAIQEMEDMEASIFLRDKLDITINSLEHREIELSQALEACLRVLSRARASKEALKLQTPLAVKEAREAYSAAAAAAANEAAAADDAINGAAAAFKVLIIIFLLLLLFLLVFIILILLLLIILLCFIIIILII
jgi:hypothetical protein